jgi:exopolysaccharide production protein ExoZ
LAWPHVDGLAQGLLVFFGHANYGVDLFFVLSGLLMADLALARWPGTARFLRLRFLRVYPAYALSSLLSAVAIWLWMGTALGPRDALGNVLLMQGLFVLGIAMANPITWSLTYEALFYAAMPLVRRGLRRTRASARWLAVALAAHLAIVGLAAAIPHDKGIYFAYFGLFVPGIALGVLRDDERERLARGAPLAAVLGAWALFTLAFRLEWLDNTQALYYPASAIAGGLLVLKAFDAGGVLGRCLATGPMRALGRISYSLFLVHFMVMQLVGEGLARTLGTARTGLYAGSFIVLGIAVSLGAAVALYLLAERPYFRASARRQPARA